MNRYVFVFGKPIFVGTDKEFQVFWKEFKAKLSLESEMPTLYLYPIESSGSVITTSYIGRSVE